MKCLVGERTASLLAEIIRDTPGNAAQIAGMANHEIMLSGFNSTPRRLTARHVNNFLYTHPDGQALVNEGLMAVPGLMRQTVARKRG